MQHLFIYILKAILVSGILIGYYWIGLRNTRFHYYNRFYLVGTVLLSLALPLLDLQWFTLSTPDSAPVQQVVQYIYPSEGFIPEQQGLTLDQLLALSLSLVSIGLVVLFGVGVIKVYLLKSKGKVTVMERFDFIETALDEAPFSFFRNLFWRRDLPIHDETGQRMLKHELTHIEQYHSYDKLFVAFTTYLFWINPFFWLIRKELEVVHEFIADEEAVAGDDAAALAEMLLKAHYHSNILSIGQSFFYSSIKRRIIMLTSSKKVSYSYARRLLILPVAIGVLVLLSFTIKDSLSESSNSQMNLAGIAESKQDSVPAKYRDPKTGQIKGSFQIDIDGDTAIFKDVRSKKKLFEVLLSQISGKTPIANFVEGFELGSAKNIFKVTSDSLILTERKISGELSAATVILRSSIDTGSGLTESTFITKGTKVSGTPLVVVDGVPIQDINVVRPSEIESVNILKDASAKALYGEKAAYGVILITTKKGNGGAAESSLSEKEVVTVIGRPSEKKVVTVIGHPIAKEIVSASGDKGGKIVTIKVDTVSFQQKPASKVSGLTSTLKTSDKFIMEKAVQGEDVTAVNIVEEGGKKVYYIQRKVTASNNLPAGTLFVVDGKVVTDEEMKAISPDKIQSINVLKGASAEAKYGDKGKNGVVEITSKKN